MVERQGLDHTVLYRWHQTCGVRGEEDQRLTMLQSLWLGGGAPNKSLPSSGRTGLRSLITSVDTHVSDDSRLLREGEMELTPELKLGWLNGWILLCVLYGLFGALLVTFPRDVVARLYDRSGWTRKQRVLTAIGKLPALAYLGLIVYSPLKVGEAVFFIGSVVFALGFGGFVVALFNFKDTPADQPITKGLYSVSRNPQVLSLIISFLGIGIATGSWFAVLTLVVLSLGAHIRVLAEEQACLQKYGDSYRGYLERVPRYFLFV